MKQYFLDDEGDMTRDNCHPRFATLAPEDFYYDPCDDFAPFGSDTGHDTLAALQDWYQEGGRDGDIISFVRRLVVDWDYPVPEGMWRTGPEQHTRLEGCHFIHLSVNSNIIQAGFVRLPFPSGCPGDAREALIYS